MPVIIGEFSFAVRTRRGNIWRCSRNRNRKLDRDTEMIYNKKRAFWSLHFIFGPERCDRMKLGERPHLLASFAVFILRPSANAVWTKPEFITCGMFVQIFRLQTNLRSSRGISTTPENFDDCYTRRLIYKIIPVARSNNCWKRSLLNTHFF